MKIKVERILNGEGEIVFTIKVSEPKPIKYTAEEWEAMNEMDEMVKKLEKTGDINGKIYQAIKTAHHGIKDNIFNKIMDALKFSIENELRPKFRPMVQEIYNWIYDHQEGKMKEWLMQFDPERTRYYFDNDVEVKNQEANRAYNEDVEVEDGDDEED